MRRTTLPLRQAVN